MVYPMGAAVAPFRITPQARSSIAYPSGSVTSEYPKGMIGRYPSGVPEITQKISTTRIPSIKIPFGGTGRGGHSRGGFAPVIPSRLIIMPKEDERRGRTIRKLKKKQPYREIIPLRRMFLPGKMPDFERRFTILPGTNRVVGGMVRPEFEGRFLKPTQEYRATRGKGWIEAQPVHIPKKEQPPIKLPDMGRRVPLHTIFAGTGGRINTRMMNVPPVNLGPVAGKRRKGRKGGLRLL